MSETKAILEELKQATSELDKLESIDKLANEIGVQFEFDPIINKQVEAGSKLLVYRDQPKGYAIERILILVKGGQYITAVGGFNLEKPPHNDIFNDPMFMDETVKIVVPGLGYMHAGLPAKYRKELTVNF